MIEETIVFTAEGKTNEKPDKAKAIAGMHSWDEPNLAYWIAQLQLRLEEIESRLGIKPPEIKQFVVRIKDL
jgi:hypothetical protein